MKERLNRDKDRGKLNDRLRKELIDLITFGARKITCNSHLLTLKLL